MEKLGSKIKGSMGDLLASSKSIGNSDNSSIENSPSFAPRLRNSKCRSLNMSNNSLGSFKHLHQIGGAISMSKKDIVQYEATSKNGLMNLSQLMPM